MEYFAIASLAVELLPLALALKYGRTWTSVVYFVTLPVLWFVVVELISGHMMIAANLLWIYPAPWIFLLTTMKRRRDQLGAARDEALRSANLAE
jgi:hypothetical protein